MNQYENHPFTEALNVIAPVIVPSFELISLRDDERQVYKNPVLQYVIGSIVNKVLDKSTMKFRTTYSIILNLAVFETKNPLDWCKYEELKDAQDRQALFSKLEGLIQNVIVLLIDPSRASKDIRNEDSIYYKYQFVYEGLRDGIYFSKKGTQNLTGVAIEFNLSCFTEDNSICCVDDETKEIASSFQPLVKEGSVSYLKLQKRIDE